MDAGCWLWQQDDETARADSRELSEPPSLPAACASRAIYVFGVASNTACGVLTQNDRLKLKGTPRGDGTRTWISGRIGNVGRYYCLPAEHGNLCDTSEHFGALVELLVKGSTTALSETPPATRAVEADAPLVFDAGPPAVLGDAALAAAAVGSKSRTRIRPRPKRRLEVGVTASDLRFLTQPVLVGHYELDPIAGPQALIDRELLDGELSRRRALGLYAGPRGTATVVLHVAPVRPLQPGMVRGAVVTGLGRYEQPLNAGDLTEAVRAGVLRLLLQRPWRGAAALEAPTGQALLDGSLDSDAAAALAARERLLQEFRDKFERLMIKRRELDSVLSHLCKLSRLADALYLYSGQAALWHVAAHLVALAQGPGSSNCKRAHKAGPRPGGQGAPVPAGPPVAGSASAARKRGKR